MLSRKLDRRMSIISNYQPCLKSFPKHLFALIVRSMKKNAMGICDDAGQREDIVRNLKCFTGNVAKVAEIGHQSMAMMRYLDRMTNSDLILPAMCCGYNLISERAKSTVDNICRENKVRRGLQYFQSMASSFGSDKLNYLCSTYGDTETCNRRIPNTLKEIESILNRSDERTIY